MKATKVKWDDSCLTFLNHERKEKVITNQKQIRKQKGFQEEKATRVSAGDMVNQHLHPNKDVTLDRTGEKWEYQSQAQASTEFPVISVTHCKEKELKEKSAERFNDQHPEQSVSCTMTFSSSSSTSFVTPFF